MINLQYTTIKTPLPKFIYDALEKYSHEANSYQPQPKELIERLANKHNVPPEYIYLTAGADEAIQMFAKAYGQNAFVFTPAYTVYADVEEFGGKLTKLPSIVSDTFSICSDTIVDASLIFLANPNNPSGITKREHVLELVKNNIHAKVVVDEAYGEFAEETVIHKVIDFPNLAVFRSFSKAYGMAGNRVGYMVTHPTTIQVVKKKSQWANVSYLSVGAAMAALDHEDYFVNMRSEVGSIRDACITSFRHLGFSVFPSKINAILLRFISVKEATRFVIFLTNNSIIVSHGNGNSNIGLDMTYVRIAVGTKDQMSELLKIIGSYDISPDSNS